MFFQSTPINITTPPDDPVVQQILGPDGWFKIFRIESVILGGAVWVLIIAGVAMFLCITLSGLQWLNSGGDKASVQNARSRLTNCLIGLSIISLAWAFILVIQAFFGFNIFVESGTQL